MRILLSSVGRRGYLVRFFKEAITPHDEVWGGDCSTLASAFYDCDNAIHLPEVTHPGYAEETLDLCTRCGIDILVPLIDPELEVLANHRQQFYDAGVMVVVSPPETIAIGFDKYLTYQFGRERGIPVLETVLTVEEARERLAAGTFQWPLVVKPRKGSASANITYCHDELALQSAFTYCPAPMIQAYVEGEEYGFDLFCDRDYRPVSVFCKRKLAMRAGETDKAVSVDEPELLDLGRKIATELHLFGPLDADVMVGPDGPKLLELNPRFGGGYPCSHLCGADFPRKIIAIWKGEPLVSDPAPYPAGIRMFKQDEIICRYQEQIDSITTHTSARSSKRINLLFTSAGRRVSLIKQFRRAANDLGIKVGIHAADVQAMAPALQIANECLLAPAISAGNYCDVLVDYCRQHEIDALIPLIDPELQPLSRHRERFAEVGTRVIISSPEVIDISIDKVRTNAFLRENGFLTPRILTGDELASAPLPLFTKPRIGSSSLGAHKIETPEDLAYFRSVNPDSIVQDFIPGVEYTVDVFADFDGRPRCAVPRRRHEVRGGEVSKSEAVKHQEMMRQHCRLVEVLGGCVGVMTIQCFLTPDDEIVFIEINPRFGGGVPLSIQAGADSPRWLLELLLGCDPDISPDAWTDRLLMLRYDEGIFVRTAELTRVGQPAV